MYQQQCVKIKIVEGPEWNYCFSISMIRNDNFYTFILCGLVDEAPYNEYLMYDSPIDFYAKHVDIVMFYSAVTIGCHES